MDVSTEERLAFRPREVAQRLGCSDDTVARLLARGELPSFRIGTGRFISAEALNEFIARAEAAS